MFSGHLGLGTAARRGGADQSGNGRRPAPPTPNHCAQSSDGMRCGQLGRPRPNKGRRSRVNRSFSAGRRRAARGGCWRASRHHLQSVGRCERCHSRKWLISSADGGPCASISRADGAWLQPVSRRRRRQIDTCRRRARLRILGGEVRAARVCRRRATYLSAAARRPAVIDQSGRAQSRRPADRQPTDAERRCFF